MIKIDYQKSEIKISGHAHYAKQGQDIVCAGVSAIVMGAINWFEKDDISLKIDEKIPLIQITLINLSENNCHKLHLIYLQLKALTEKYKNYIKIK